MKFFIAPLLVASLTTGPIQPPATPDLFEEFRAICLDWDADPEAAEEIALGRGYEPSQDLIPDDLFQRERLRVWAREYHGVSFRVVVKRGRYFNWDGEVYQDRCHVSAAPSRIGALRRDVRRHLGFGSFRQRHTDVFAWLPSADGPQAVRRPVFEHTGTVALHRRGMRMVLVRQHEDQSILGLISPVGI